MILLRPEVILRHDGRREAEDWPALLLAYGSGDGAFYMKHVRCRDPYALWLFAEQFVGTAVRVGRQDGPAPARRPTTTTSRGMLHGARASFKFGVDRAHPPVRGVMS